MTARPVRFKSVPAVGGGHTLVKVDESRPVGALALAYLAGMGGPEAMKAHADVTTLLARCEAAEAIARHRASQEVEAMDTTCKTCGAPHEGQDASDVFSSAQMTGAVEICKSCGWPSFDSSKQARA